GDATDADGIAFAFGLEALDFALAFGGHAIKNLLGDRFGKAETFNAEELNIDSVFFKGCRTEAGEDFLLDLGEFDLLGVAIHKVGKGMLADDRLLGAADETFQLRFGDFGGAIGKAVEEKLRVLN